MFRENLKRFWIISALGFILLFLSGPVRMMTGTDRYALDWVGWALGGNSYLYFFLCLALAAASCTAVFSYLFRGNSAGMMHALPFSRKRLFIENYCSGLLLALLPLVLNVIVLFIAKRPVMIDTVIDGLTVKENLYTTYNIFRGHLRCFVILLFSYSVCSLAAVISGNTVIACLTMLGLNFVLPLFFGSMTIYGSIFLRGFMVSDSLLNDIYALHPMLAMAGLGYALTAGNYILYIVTALLIAALALFVYEKRPVEKTGDSYVFEFIKYIIAFFIVFFAATLIGIIFGGLFSEEPVFAVYLIGALAGFIIAWMIVNRTWRIFNKKGLLGCAVYMLLMALILVSFKMDFFGYAKRTPKASDVESVSISTSAAGKPVYDSMDDGKTDIAEPENIEKIIQLHKEAAASPSESESGCYGWIQISYKMKNGKMLERSFSGIPYEVLSDSQDLRDILSSDEVIGNIEGQIASLSMKNADISCTWSDQWTCSNFGKILQSEDEKENLRKALISDIEEFGAEEMAERHVDFYTINFNETWQYVCTVRVYPSYIHTLAWMEENGLTADWDSIVGKNYITVTKDNQTFYDEFYDSILSLGLKQAESETGMAVITDKDMIQDILLHSKDIYCKENENTDYVNWFTYNQGSCMDSNCCWVDLTDLMPETQAEILKYAQ